MNRTGSDAALAGLLRTLEQRLLAEDTRRSAAALDALLADDFVEFGQSGRRYDKPQIIALLIAEPASDRSLDDFVLKRLGEGLALVTYLAERRTPDAPPARSRRSSIWRMDADRWQLIFHQGTPLPLEHRED